MKKSEKKRLEEIDNFIVNHNIGRESKTCRLRQETLLGLHNVPDLMIDTNIKLPNFYNSILHESKEVDFPMPSDLGTGQSPSNVGKF